MICVPVAYSMIGNSTAQRGVDKHSSSRENTPWRTLAEVNAQQDLLDDKMV